MRWIPVVLVTIMLALPRTEARAAEPRLALVVGNATYRHATVLANPANDAHAVAAVLQAAGFTLVGGGPQIDLTRSGLERAVRRFGHDLGGLRGSPGGGAIGLFYYAGHGIQVNGVNYLVPVDAEVGDEADLPMELVEAGQILDEMAQAGNPLNMVILDACRSNPFERPDRRRTRSGARLMEGGLAQVTAPAGTVIAFATQPGNTADDGSTGNSPYAAALVETIPEPGLGVLEVFNTIGVRVKQATGGRQQPWVSASPIEGRFAFVPGLPAGAAAIPAPIPEKVAPETLEAALRRGDAAAARKDHAAALEAYREAAGLGSAAAANALGEMTENGRGVPADDGAAARWYRQAAGQGHAPAQNNIAFFLNTGRGGARDPAAALDWYRKAAAQGNAVAAYNIGLFHRNGWGVAPDPAEALRWYRRTAERGGPAAATASYDIALLVQDGRGTVRDPAAAVGWLRRAAEGGLAAAQFRLGQIGIERGPAPAGRLGEGPEEGLRWLRRAAEQNHAGAQACSADSTVTGRGCRATPMRRAAGTARQRRGGDRDAAAALREMGD